MSVLSDIHDGLWSFTTSQLGRSGIIKAAEEFTTGKLSKHHKFTEAELMSIIAEPLFVEWLWFEHQVPALGDNLLSAYAHYADELAPLVAQHLHQLLETNRYTLWRVGEAIPGDLEMIDVKRGAHLRVREFSLAKEVRPNDCFFVRIAQQGDHWEIMSADTFPLNLPELSDAQAIAGELDDQVSIKDSFGYAHLINSKVKAQAPPQHRLNVSLAEARQSLKQVLSRSGIDPYISVSRVEELMRAEAQSDNRLALGMPQAVRLLLGLADDTADIDAIMEAGGALWNAVLPKSPPGASGGSSVEMRQHELVPWGQAFEEARLATISLNAPAAVAAWQSAFRIMLEESGTSRSLYRLFANAGMANLMDGNLILGERLNRIALEICPNYDFALDQQLRIDRGDFMPYAMKRVAERLSQGGLDLPPSTVKLRDWSDTKLADRLAELGLVVTKAGFADLAKSASNVKDFVKRADHLDTSGRRIDEIHTLAREANRRWAPNRPWPENLEDIATDYSEALFPEYQDERRSTRRAEKFARELNAAILAADDECIKSWIHGNYRYSDSRREIVEAGIELADYRDTSSDLLEQLHDGLASRTHDPIFLVPSALALAHQETPIKAMIARIAGDLPEDETALMVLAEFLPDSRQKDEESALLAAVEAVELRDKLKHLTLPPYSYLSLQESYIWTLEALCSFYKETNDLEKLDLYQQRYGEVMDDPSLAETETPDEQAKRKLKAAEFIDEQLEKDDPAIAYYSWFKTLGIDLSSGDGTKTQTNFIRNDPGGARPLKPGRNDPCPCGATKPDGSTVKYKKCHGA